MRKGLRILALSSGIVCAVTTVVLAYTYFEDAAEYVKTVKSKVAEKRLKAKEDKE